MARRSRGEQVRAAIGGWMPLDARQVVLLAVIGLVVVMLVSMLH
jgi:hypothetical protein